MEYVYYILDDVNFSTHTPERKAFYAHLKKVSAALHDIEWVDSGDYGRGDENEAIRACLAEGVVLQAAIDDAKAASEKLSLEIKRAENK